MTEGPVQWRGTVVDAAHDAGYARPTRPDENRARDLRSSAVGFVAPRVATYDARREDATRHAIPDQFSLFLHFWRIVATASVFIGHATRPDILFDVDFSLIGRATIPTFLMISGYFTTMSFAKGGDFLKRLVKRYWDLHVFFIPATILILAMDVYMIESGAPILLRNKFVADLSSGRIVADMFDLLTFSGEYWRASTAGQGVFSNEAIWTIDYIMGFTLLTAALYLLTGWKRAVAAVVFAIAISPKVLLMAPLWFAGVLAYELHRRILARSGCSVSLRDIRIAGRRLGSLARACIAVSIAGWMAIEYLGIGEYLYLWSKTLASYDYRQYLGMSKRFLWQWSYVPSLFLLLLFGRVLLEGQVSGRMMTAVRTASRYVLPIYAINFSTMYFIQALIPGYTPRHDSPGPYVMMGATLLLSIVFGYGCLRWIKPAAAMWAARIIDKGQDRASYDHSVSYLFRDDRPIRGEGKPEPGIRQPPLPPVQRLLARRAGPQEFQE